jgi:hypothetical protein
LVFLVVSFLLASPPISYMHFSGISWKDIKIRLKLVRFKHVDWIHVSHYGVPWQQLLIGEDTSGFIKAGGRFVVPPFLCHVDLLMVWKNMEDTGKGHNLVSNCTDDNKSLHKGL